MKKKYFLIFAGLLLVLNIFCWQEVFTLSSSKGLLKVDFLSVGQGDSEFIETPTGNKILIDGGPDSTVLGKLNNLLPFWDREIDLVILTHPEKDHMAGLLDVLQRYNVKYFVWSGVFKDDAESRQLATLLKRAQKPQNNFLAALTDFQPTKAVAVSIGDKIKIGNVKLDILFPAQSFAGQTLKENASANETCVVDKITYGKDSFLFTGDIDEKAEAEIVNSGENIQANVLKVAHHGSKYSSTDLFLAAVKPSVAVIEVGNNSYGHPTPETLQRLENFGIKVKRTDKDGDVIFLSNGNNIILQK